MASASTGSAHDEEGSALVGWLAGVGLILLTILIGAGLWIHFHGL
jgi:hypothetical protein